MNLADPTELAYMALRAMAAPSRVSVCEAAQESLMINGNGGLTKWDETVTPYMVEPMNTTRSRLFSTLAFQGPARAGKTAGLILPIMIHGVLYKPSKVMMVHMSETEAGKFVKDELNPALNANAKIRALKSRQKSDDTIGFKIFTNTALIEVTHPVSKSFRGKSREMVLITDLDAIPSMSEGSVYELSKSRIKNYLSAGIVIAESSPGTTYEGDFEPSHPHESLPVEGISSIYMQGDRRRWYWQCPHCGEWFVPEFELLVFDRDEKDAVKASQNVYLSCPHCGSCIYEKEKNKLNQTGKWLKQGQTIDKDGVIHGEGLVSTTASFWLPPLAAAFAVWSDDFVKDYIEAKAKLAIGDSRPMQVFYNTKLGRVYKAEPIKDIELNTLESNRSRLPLGTLPNDTKILLAAVDVQGGKHRRFEVQIHAICENRIQYVVHRFAITQYDEKPIEPNIYTEHWGELTRQVLDREWLTEDGQKFRVAIMAYDTNGESGVTHRAYEYYKTAPKSIRKRLFPIKGVEKQKELVQRSKQRDRLYLLDSNRIKDLVYSNMNVNAGEERSMIYSHELSDSFYDELLSETVKDGKWTKASYRANESFDLACYIQAILVHERLHETNDIPLVKRFYTPAPIKI